MKKKHVGKSIISMLLVVSLVLGMIGIMPKGQEVEAADTTTNTTKVLAEELEGYRRISVTDFVYPTDSKRLVDKEEFATTDGGFQLGHAQEGHYIGEFGGKTYLDVDVCFNGVENGRFDYQVNQTNVDHWKYRYGLTASSANGVQFISYVNSTATYPIEVDMVDYGVSLTEYFNVKILTNIVSEGDGTDTVTLQLWLNNKFAGEFTQQETSYDRTRIMGYSGSGKIVSFREPKVLEKELEGYTKVTLADYGFAIDTKTNTHSMVNGSITSATEITDFNKTYLDMDINFNEAGSTNWSGRYIQYQGTKGARYSECFCISPNGNKIKLWMYTATSGSNKNVDIKEFDASAYGVTSFAEPFNVKLRTDIETDSEKENVTIQFWINDRFAYEGTVTQVKHDRAGLCGIIPKDTTVTVGIPAEEKKLEKELSGYQQITMADYGLSMDANQVAILNNQTKLGSTRTDYNKTYLDVDVNFNITGNESNASQASSSQYFQYQGSADYNECFCISPDPSKSTIKLWMYTAISGTNEYRDISSFKLSDYGISSYQEYFNLKLRTDIKVDTQDTTKEHVTIQVWINEKFAYEGTVTQVAHTRNWLKCVCNVNPPIYVRSPLSVDDSMKGYKRVTIGDFEGLGASVAEGIETTYLSAKAGDYIGQSLDNTYLDVDVKTSAGLFMSYLTTPNATNPKDFYGNGNQLRFTLSETTLVINQILNGDNGAFKPSVNLASHGVVSGEFFNIKLRTDIETNATDSSQSDITLQLWINNKYVATYTYTETTRDMTYAGVRGTSAGTTIVKTPIEDVTDADISYDLSKGSYLLTGADSFIVNGTTMAEGETITTPGDYIIERIVNNEVVSIQCASLYILGDVNLDGSAFEDGNPVWKDSYAMQGVLNHGSSVKAMLKAADLDNDGEVTNTDLSLIYSIRSDVTQAQEILAKYHVPSFTYDSLGGDEVMPIAGFYGPYNDANITDKVYKWIKDAGINLITYYNNDYNNDPNRVLNNLALAEKYGIGLYIKDSGTNTITTDSTGNVTGHSYLSSASDIAERFGNYSRFSSFLGMSIVDEPKSKSDSTNKSYTYYEKFAEALKQYSNVTGYINLNGSVALDKGEYKSYLEEIAPDVNILSFDNYPLYDTIGNNILSLQTRQTRRLQTYLESLDSVRQVAKDNKIPFMSYVQAGSDYRDDKSNGKTTDVLSEAETQWIVNTSLAYGAKGIAWFPLLQPEYFSYDSTDTENGGHDYDRNGIIGADNEKNAYYTIVQKTNKQIAAIDEVLMKANNTGVIVTGKAATDIENTVRGRDYTFTGIKEKANGTYTTQLKDVTTGDKGVMVGCFEYRDSEAFYVVNYDTTQGATQTITLTFNGSYQYRLIQDAKTTYGNDETATLTIPAGAGVLVVLEEHIVEYTAAEFATYRTGETFIAPEAPVGYVFAGWFTNASCTSAVPMNAKTVSVEKVYAKFVDENLLNVKAQILANTERDSKTTDIRFVFAVDTLSYSKIGFLIKQGDKVRDRSNNKVYTTLSAYDEYGKTQAEFTPQNVFCETATRFKTWTITGVPNTSFETPFEVTAYWITKDGTKVCSPQATKIIFDAIQ